MIRLYFIRHGSTAGNLQRRYIGRSDESLCTEGEEEMKRLKEKKLKPDVIFVSPMLRARQSADILFPERDKITVSDFRETDFGIFEGKTAEELSDCPEYSKWLESMCKAPIPGGEAVSDFKQRVCAAFEDRASKIKDGSSAAFVIHGGAIMAILERFSRPQRDFYSYHIKNGEYFSCVYRQGIIELDEENDRK